MHAKGGALSLLPSTRRNCRSTKLIAAIVFGAPVPQSCEEISGFPVHTGSTFVVCRSVRQSILILLASWGVPITDITQARSASRKRRSAATDGEIRREIRWSAKFKRWLESHCTNSNPHVCYHIRQMHPSPSGTDLCRKFHHFIQRSLVREASITTTTSVPRAITSNGRISPPAPEGGRAANIAAA